MIASRWKLASAPIAVIALASPLFASCKKPVPAVATAASASAGGGVACEEMKTGNFANLQIIATTDVQNRMRRLLSAGYALSKTGKQLERELIDACAELGKAAEVADLDLKADPNDGKGAEKVCGNVGVKVGKLIKDAREAKIELTIEYEPPRCYSDVDAMRQCLADCGSPSNADIRASCKGGEISGRCAAPARCGGSCVLEAGPGTSACRAVCTGKCDRDFRGACGGRCDGTCNGLPNHGKPCKGICDGACSGKAEGVCGGRCDGACSGSSEPRDPSRCAGRCVGACSSPIESPVCSGDYAPPGVEISCQSSCAAVTSMAARCEAPMVRITAKGGRQNADFQRLLAGLQAELPKIIRLREGSAKRLSRAIEGMIAGGVDMTNANALAGERALFCVRSASDAAKASQDAMDVAVKGSEWIMRALKNGL